MYEEEIKERELKDLYELEGKLKKNEIYLKIDSSGGMEDLYKMLGYNCVSNILNKVLNMGINARNMDSGRINDCNYSYELEGGLLQIDFEYDGVDFDEFSDPENPYGSML